MRTIVHVTADYPDPVVPGKTKAIKNLISASRGYRHVIYSLNRVGNTVGFEPVRFGKNGTSLKYGAPPKGFLLKYGMNRVAEWISQDLMERKIEPDFLHAHKLTIEGIATFKLAKRFNIPFVASIQGDTDLKVSKYKPGLHGLYSQIWHGAEHVFPFSLWAEQYFANLFGSREKPTHLLPCITPQDELLVSAPKHKNSIVSVFHLDSWKRKNAARLIEAAKKTSLVIPGLTLDIYGSGSAASHRGLLKCIRKNGAEEIVRLKGSLDHNKVQQTINRYSMFALPSLRESFGMAAAEALMSGVPVLISKNWGIDGIFPENEIGGVCNPYSSDHMSEKIIAILMQESDLKNRIKDSQQSGKLNILKRGSIVGTYLEALADMDRQSVFRHKPLMRSEASLQA